MDDTTFEHLQKADWESIGLRLTHYAARKAYRYRWNSRIAIGGQSSEDLAFEAITKVLDGDRKWDPQEDPDLFKYLTCVVDSLISHLSDSPERTRVQGFPQNENGEIVEERLKMADPESETARHLRGPNLNPEQILLNKEQEQIEQRAFKELLKAAEGDDDLEALLLCIMDGVCKPSEIAKATGMNINQVYQLRRKLNRKVVHLKMTVNF